VVRALFSARTIGPTNVPKNRTLTRWRGLLAHRSGPGRDHIFFPGVRRKRVLLAKFLAPLRGA